MGLTPQGYTKKRSEMTPEELAAARAYDKRMADKHRAAKRIRNRDWYRNKPDEEKKKIVERISAVRRERTAALTEPQLAARLEEWRRPENRVKGNLRRRWYEAIKSFSRGVTKRFSATRLLGDAEVSQIVSQLHSGMTLENYGKVWDLDHVVPCAWFDLTKESHQRACFHISNVRPELKAVNRGRRHAVRRQHFDYVLARCPKEHVAAIEEVIWKIRRREFSERKLANVLGHV